MNHDEIQDRLEAYIDDRLTREERREVDRHLEGCDECRAILDDVAPVDLSGLDSMTYDETAMRRTVRRSMFRTAWDTALLLLAGWMVIWIVSALLVQPLVVNRGGRAADAVRMSIDVGTMLNPGATLTDGAISSDLASRRVDLEYRLPVGAGLEPLGQTSTTIGVFGVSASDFGSSIPIFGSGGQEMMGEAADQLANLGSGTVATVALRYETPLTVGDAQAIAEAPGADVRVVWAGFDASLGQETSPAWTFTGTLGYGTCLNQDPLGDDLLSATSASFSQGGLFGKASVQEALDSVIAALENIQSRPEFVEYLVKPYNDDPATVSAVLTSLQDDPRVATLVVTGPSPEVASFVETSQGAFASVLAVDFYNWSETVCGGLGS